jgi:hypothetical protein
MEILKFATSVNLDIVLSEVSQTQKEKYCSISLIYRIWNSQTHENGDQSEWWMREVEEGGNVG